MRLRARERLLLQLKDFPVGVCIVRYKSSHYFPSTIGYLRIAADLDRDSRIALEGLTNQFLSFRIQVRNCPLAILGMYSLTAMALFPVWQIPFKLAGILS
jgi:hypothetical protein